MIFFSAYLMGIFLEIFRFWEFWIGIVLEGLRGFDFFKRFTFLVCYKGCKIWKLS